MDQPLVSVIALCYNHAAFVEESLQSVITQTYPHVELIIVDDASTDDSKSVIRSFIEKHPDVKFIDIAHNLGNCAAFNKGLAIAKGEYIVDLATDDVLMPDRLEKQLQLFNELDETYGVIHTNAIYIDENGHELRDHTQYLKSKGLLQQMPAGSVYKDIIQQFFVAGPSMLVKKKVFDQLGGYDEILTYEDFDFWVRSSRSWKYAYLDEPLTKIRKVTGSKSKTQYKIGDSQLHSTFLVCEKIHQLNRNQDEDAALIKRLKFEIRQSVFSNNYKEAQLFSDLLRKHEKPSVFYQFLLLLSKLHLPMAPLRNLYHKAKYQQV